MGRYVVTFDIAQNVTIFLPSRSKYSHQEKFCKVVFLFYIPATLNDKNFVCIDLSFKKGGQVQINVLWCIG